ncbi:hypothetical protein Bca52824_004779 [Brassica carinata]|uniref:Uncharacterized protein n=1 Tax=Brassica carinata TaxID=52824 RepID=A0A8X7WM97_BRACI|nr:hypothetical protein Bca52824_004779 [Brassica carinata]
MTNHRRAPSFNPTTEEDNAILCCFSSRSTGDTSACTVSYPISALQLQCCSLDVNRYVSAIFCQPGPENTLAGLLQFQSEIETCSSSAVCHHGICHQVLQKTKKKTFQLNRLPGLSEDLKTMRKIRFVVNDPYVMIN